MNFTKEQKKAYWQNRKDGIRGQGKLPKPTYVENTDVQIVFDSNGNIVAANRAYRRKPVKLHLKSSQRRKKKERK